MTKKCILIVWVTAMLLHSSLLSFSQQADSDSNMYSMSLEDLMDIEINVASKNKSSLRESPGIISVITGEQIQKMGARDLIDVLRLVPGFQFGVDVQGIVGVGIRGNWAHEGKMSLQIDGLEINETLFSTTQFGHHFPVDNIKRIEIIRGPGSALYGGYAELGVVNIITRDAKDIDGVGFGTAFSEMDETHNQRNISFSLGQKVNDFDVSLHTYLSSANRSQKTYTGFNEDYSGFEEYDMKDNSAINAFHVNLGVKKGQFKNRLIIDRYDVQSKDAFDVVTDSYFLSYNTMLFSSEYGYEINDKLTITPELVFKQQEPYYLNNENAKGSTMFFNVASQRITSRVTANYNVNEKLNIIAGGEIFRNDGLAGDPQDYFVPSDTSNARQSSINYMSYGAFSQGTYKYKYVDFLVGVRFEENSVYGSSFVPRVALTKAFEKFHYKILASQAYRNPGISNINANRNAILEGYPDLADIEPEKTTVMELELGYKPMKNVLVTANLFDMTIDKPIVYFYDDELEIEGYQNYSQSGTRGLEVDIKYSGTWGSVNATYSHYMQADKNKVDTYAVPESFDQEALVGFARDKATLYATFNVWKGLSVSPWVVYTGKKYGWAPEWDDDEGDAVWDINHEFDPTINLNVFVNYKNLFIDKLSLGAGVYNIMDEEMFFVQPYSGYHTALPDASRSYRVKLSYNLF
ncbi:MAG: TonB-dependent receptor plug domain-containing protein [Salinivirgaceae bacterium]|jgi:outer membrane receptor for ferrienterochelin and colicin|nr:TonB-dependent receptor plug domain-containing protein [Salinivirgaceae bacterium]